jgi:Cd2+/Zn2+-exporting ATPase
MSSSPTPSHTASQKSEVNSAVDAISENAPVHDHGHGHGHGECCPFHEALSDRQVQQRLLLALYGGAILLSGSLLKSISPQHGGPWLQLLACAIMAFPILGDAISGIKRGQLGFPSLVALAFCACLSQGDILTAGLVAFFMIMADQLENRSAIGARLAIESLIRHTPEQVHLVQGDTVMDIPAKDLNLAQVIEVRPGEVLSIDGTVSEGESTLDESSITGESLPVMKSKGTPVYAGTVNLSGRILVSVTQIGEDTTVGKVKQLILSASKAKTN